MNDIKLFHGDCVGLKIGQRLILTKNFGIE